MPNSKIARSVKFGGPSPTNNLISSFAFNTFRTQNIETINNGNIKTKSINSDSINSDSINSDSINSNFIYSNQGMPENEIFQDLSFNLGNKYYYTDNVPRSRMSIKNQENEIISTILNPTFIKQIPHNNSKFKIKHNKNPPTHPSNHANLGHPYDNYHLNNNNIPEYAFNKYIINLSEDISFNNKNINLFNTDLSGFLINVDNNKTPTGVSWGPKILDQGYLGDCYAFTSSTVISFSHSRLLKNKTDISDSELHKISNYMLPSMIYIEKIFNRTVSSFSNNYNPFSQGGFNIFACHNYLTQKSHVLEFQYTYPLLLTSENFNGYTNNTKNYLINEFVDKVINDTPNDILSCSEINKYYKNIYNNTNNSLNKISFKLYHVLPEDMYNQLLHDYYDISLANTDPFFNYESISELVNLKDNYKNIIINNINTLIDNSFAIAIAFPVSKEIFEDNPKRTFKTPTSINDIEGGHAVTIVGYDNSTEKFIIQNSWGNLGINNTGYFYINYNMIDFMLGNYNINHFLDFFTVEFSLS